MMDILEKVAEYRTTYGVAGRAHYLASDKYKLLNRLLGIPVIIITTVVGTTIFATLGNGPDPAWSIFAGLFSLVGAVLASLQTSLGYAKTSEEHKTAAAKFRDIRRRLDLFGLRYGAAPPDLREEALVALEQIQTLVSDISESGPNIPDSCYDKAKKEAESEGGPVRELDTE